MSLVSLWDARHGSTVSRDVAGVDIVAAVPLMAPWADGARLHASFTEMGTVAFAVARVVTGSGVLAEETVVEAFAANRRGPIGVTDGDHRLSILASVVAGCARRRGHGPEPAAGDGWARLPFDQRVALALVLRAGCDLDDVGIILAADRATVARSLRDALRSAKSTTEGHAADRVGPPRG